MLPEQADAVHKLVMEGEGRQQGIDLGQGASALVQGRSSS